MEIDQTASNFYDRVEVHENVTVQVLINTKTGESSIGWTRNHDMIEAWRESAHETSC